MIRTRFPIHSSYSNSNPLQTKHYSGSKFKSFGTQEEAAAFVQSYQRGGSESNSSAHDSAEMSSQSTKRSSRASSSKQTTSSSSFLQQKDPKRRKLSSESTETTPLADGGNPTDDTTTWWDDESWDGPPLWNAIDIWFDGGSRGNPGIAGAGTLVKLMRGKDVVVRHIRIRKCLRERATNNEAEY